MRLISLTVRNYRIHKDLTVTFDPSRNLIGGPNESGKSTLAEAAHRALFLRAKTGGSIQKEMVSTHLGGDPEVALTFEAAGVRWELEKRFAATKGSTRLSGTGMATLKDEAADAKLTEILKTESGGRANAGQLAATWSHLWVWQGSSGQDPADHASAHKDTLVQRLQKDGIAAVMQSATDQRVREKIAASYDDLFTATGKPKAGSKPELARTQLTEAEAALLSAQETAARLEQAVSDHARAEKEIADVDAVLPSLRVQLTATEAKLTRVTELQRHEETQLRAFETAAASREQIAKDDTNILSLHHQAGAARQALLPAEEKQSTLTADEQSARTISQTADNSQRQAAESVRQARLHHDFATATLASFEKSDAHQRLATRSAEAGTIRAELTTVRATLAQLPLLTAKDLTSLRKLERETGQATATLEAMATGIELLNTDTTVTLDGQTLTITEARILTDVGELAIGNGTRLRIRPGGGTSLSEARSRSESAHRAFSAALARLTLRDLDHASTVLEQRQALEQQIAQLETRWKALGGESLATELTSAANALDAATAEVQRRKEALANDPNLSSPANLPEARTLLATTQQQLSQAENAEIITRRSAEQLRSRLEAATQALQSHRDQLSTTRQVLRDLETRIKVLEDSHGDATARQNSLAQARDNEAQTNEQLATTRQALAALAPANLSDDLARFQRAISQQETRRRNAENQRLIARDRLTLDGSNDPDADLSYAQARLEAAREIHTSENRRAKAIEKLHLLFSSSREAINRSLVQPLADRISGYLQCIFGPGAGVRVNLSDTGIEGLDLIRPGDPASNFAILSGGAKEQVAAATRLAMAEILAADHDNCLPILFDDAFAYTDPDRVQALQRMLDLAAIRGLQIIVLTCTPSEYTGLGASFYQLNS
ncbi:MAG: AAA family ATPase [Verrucomicrobia bacterium]|nr:AAA family ATPase [Verrucomicrobiota bacterium]